MMMYIDAYNVYATAASYRTTCAHNLTGQVALVS